MNANEKQVGGDHYKGRDYEHWDWILDMYGPSYIIGCATKYISRWRNKNGAEDIEKAIHYAEKLAQWFDENPGTIVEIPPHISKETMTTDFVVAYELGIAEALFCYELVNAENGNDVRSALRWAHELMAQNFPKSSIENSGPEDMSIMDKIMAMREAHPEFRTVRTEHPAPFGYNEDEEVGEPLDQAELADLEREQPIILLMVRKT